MAPIHLLDLPPQAWWRLMSFCGDGIGILACVSRACVRVCVCVSACESAREEQSATKAGADISADEHADEDERLYASGFSRTLYLGCKRMQMQALARMRPIRSLTHACTHTHSDAHAHTDDHARSSVAGHAEAAYGPTVASAAEVASSSRDPFVCVQRVRDEIVAMDCKARLHVFHAPTNAIEPGAGNNVSFSHAHTHALFCTRRCGERQLDSLHWKFHFSPTWTVMYLRDARQHPIIHVLDTEHVLAQMQNHGRVGSSSVPLRRWRRDVIIPTIAMTGRDAWVQRVCVCSPALLVVMTGGCLLVYDLYDCSLKAAGHAYGVHGAIRPDIRHVLVSPDGDVLLINSEGACAHTQTYSRVEPESHAKVAAGQKRRTAHRGMCSVALALGVDELSVTWCDMSRPTRTYVLDGVEETRVQHSGCPDWDVLSAFWAQDLTFQQRRAMANRVECSDSTRIWTFAQAELHAMADNVQILVANVGILQYSAKQLLQWRDLHQETSQEPASADSRTAIEPLAALERRGRIAEFAGPSLVVVEPGSPAAVSRLVVMVPRRKISRRRGEEAPAFSLTPALDIATMLGRAQQVAACAAHAIGCRHVETLLVGAGHASHRLHVLRS